jgi:hypothetical protein
LRDAGSAAEADGVWRSKRKNRERMLAKNMKGVLKMWVLALDRGYVTKSGEPCDCVHEFDNPKREGGKQERRFCDKDCYAEGMDKKWQNQAEFRTVCSRVSGPSTVLVFLKELTNIKFET